MTVTTKQQALIDALNAVILETAGSSTQPAPTPPSNLPVGIGKSTNWGHQLLPATYAAAAAQAAADVPMLKSHGCVLFRAEGAWMNDNRWDWSAIEPAKLGMMVSWPIVLPGRGDPVAWTPLSLAELDAFANAIITRHVPIAKANPNIFELGIGNETESQIWGGLNGDPAHPNSGWKAKNAAGMDYPDGMKYVAGRVKSAAPNIRITTSMAGSFIDLQDLWNSKTDIGAFDAIGWNCYADNQITHLRDTFKFPWFISEWNSTTAAASGTSGPLAAAGGSETVWAQQAQLRKNTILTCTQNAKFEKRADWFCGRDGIGDQFGGDAKSNSYGIIKADGTLRAPLVPVVFS